MPEISFFSKNYSINCNGRIHSFSAPLIMGILNLSTDSFFDGGNYMNPTYALKHVEKMLYEGADIIDIGTFSSKPGSQISNPNDEIARLTPIIKEIRKQFGDVLISIDTYHSSVANASINEGASIINDISAGNIDRNMFSTIAKLNVPYIMMHMQGEPMDMQNNPTYKNITKDISYFFSERLNELNSMGVKDVIIDPGFGFGKTVNDNFELLQNLSYFKIFERPILVGLSRKSMIYKLLNETPENSLNGTSVLNSIALIKGASILRVHDVKEAKEIVKLISAVDNPHDILL